MRTYTAVFQRLRKEHGYRQQDVADYLCDMGIKTAHTQVSRWEQGNNNPSIEQFVGLCKLYAIKDVHQVFENENFTEPEEELNKEGRKKLDDYRKLLVESGKFAAGNGKILQFPNRVCPVYDTRVSAGTGQLFDSESCEMMDVPSYVPVDANFGVYVSGNSMEPTLHDGELIWVKKQQALENGNIGVFWLDGEFLVKEVSVTDDGASLISHNPKYGPRNITEYSDIVVYGKVVWPN